MQCNSIHYAIGILSRNHQCHNILEIIINCMLNASMFQLISALSTLTGVFRWYIAEELSQRITLGQFMAQIHTLKPFLFPRCLWVNLKWEEKARGGLNTDVWSEHCVCRKVRGQKKCSEPVIGQSLPCPLVELPIVWMKQVATNTHTPVHRGWLRSPYNGKR